MIGMQTSPMLWVPMLHPSNDFRDGTLYRFRMLRNENCDDKICADTAPSEVEAQIAGFIEEDMHEKRWRVKGVENYARKDAAKRLMRCSPAPISLLLIFLPN